MLTKRDKTKLNRLAYEIENITHELDKVYASERIDEFLLDVLKIGMERIHEYMIICFKNMNNKACCKEGREFYYNFLRPAINTWNKAKKKHYNINKIQALWPETCMEIMMAQSVAWSYLKALTPVLVMENKQEHLHENNRAFILDKMIQSVGGKNEQKPRRAT